MKQIDDLYQRICRLLATIYNQNGKRCAQPYTDRVVSLTIEKLRDIPHRIGEAGLHSKSAAIQGALRGGGLPVLITDETAAQGMMELQAIPQGG